MVNLKVLLSEVRCYKEEMKEQHLYQIETVQEYYNAVNSRLSSMRLQLQQCRSYFFPTEEEQGDHFLETLLGPPIEKEEPSLFSNETLNEEPYNEIDKLQDVSSVLCIDERAETPIEREDFPSSLCNNKNHIISSYFNDGLVSPNAQNPKEYFHKPLLNIMQHSFQGVKELGDNERDPSSGYDRTPIGSLLTHDKPSINSIFGNISSYNDLNEVSEVCSKKENLDKLFNELRSKGQKVEISSSLDVTRLQSEEVPFYDNDFLNSKPEDEWPQQLTRCSMVRDASHFSESGESSSNHLGFISSKKNGTMVDSLKETNNLYRTKYCRVKEVKNGRPIVEGDPEREFEELRSLDININGEWNVLVEFKRKRVQQYKSNSFLVPGIYVVVDGDRGEDAGLVTHVWYELNKEKAMSLSLSGATIPNNIGAGSKNVIRRTTTDEVEKILNLHSELEKRALEICSQQVLEHNLPMVVIDTEYQFDNKKLSFYFEAQQRMDFRNLINSLYQTFHTRIWLEPVET